MTLPRTPAEYHRHINESLNWFEQLADKATSLDERINVTNRLLMEILRVSAEEKPPPFFPPALSDALMDHLTKNRPEFYKFVDIDLSTARTNLPYEEVGTFIQVNNQFARGEVKLRLNEEFFDTFDLRHQKYIQGPFTRFFVTNVAGQGNIRLFVSRGFQAASESVEAINLAELAARLGYPSFDRRGDVVCVDNFEDGINQCIPVTDGAGASVDWSATRAKSKGFSCLLTGGSDGARYAGIYKYLPYLVSGPLGFEVSFSVDYNTSAVVLEMYIFDGAKYLFPSISFDITSSTLSYLDDTAPTGAWVNLSPVPDLVLGPSGGYLFHTVKVVVDYASKEYVRMMVDNVMYNLKHINVLETEDISPPRVYFGILNYSRLEVPPVNDKVYVDDPIVTQNEP